MTPYPHEYFQQLANLTGIYHYSKNNPFGSKAGALIGLKDGYLVSVGPMKNEKSTGIGILIRFKKNENAEVVRSTVQFSPVLLAALKIKELSDKHRKEFQITDDSLFWMWPYVFKKPAPELVAELTASLLAAVRQTVSGFNGKCEVCDTNATPEITMYNAVPGYYCESCRQNILRELGIFETAYEEKEANVALGVLYGTAGMIAGGIAWGMLAYSTEHIYAIAAIGIGFLIAWLVEKGMGKVTIAGKILVGLLTLCSVLFGDLVFFTLILMKENASPFSLELFMTVLQNFVEIEIRSENIATLLFAMLGAYYALSKFSKPKFKATFEPLQ